MANGKLNLFVFFIINSIYHVQQKFMIVMTGKEEAIEYAVISRQKVLKLRLNLISLLDIFIVKNALEQWLVIEER